MMNTTQRGNVRSLRGGSYNCNHSTKRTCKGGKSQGGVKREGEREQSTPREPPALVKKPKLSTSPK